MSGLLNYLSKKIWSKPLYQHIFFFTAAILTVLLMGYYFGTFDQASHIPFLKKYADPSLYPNDKFFDLKNYHYSFFWLFFAPFYRLGILEITMFVIHIFATYLTFYTIYRLSKTIFNNPLTSFLSVLVFIIPHAGLSGFPVFEFSLLNRTFVLPFLLLAINVYLNDKVIRAFVILGIMYNLHVVSVNFVLAMFLLDLLLRIRPTGLKNILSGLTAFIIPALPVLIWKFSNSRVDAGINLKWFNIINNGVFYHIFNFITLKPLILLLSLGGIGLYFIFFFAKGYSKSPHDRSIVNFIFASIIILVVQFLATAFAPLTIIIQSQIVRVGIFVLIFSYIYFANYLSVELIQKNKKIYLGMMVSGFFLSISPITLALTILIKKMVKSRVLNLIAVVSIIICFIGSSAIIYKVNIWKPGIHIFPPHDDLYDLEIWARNNSPKDAVFITPPHLWWFYNIEWRVISERSTIVTLSDLLEAAFVPSYIDHWIPRFESVAPGVISKFQGDVFENFSNTRTAYYSLTDDEIRKIAGKYHASYFVVEKPHRYSFPPIHENKKYIIYKLDFIHQ